MMLLSETIQTIDSESFLMYDVYIGNDSASLGSERTDIMNTKGKKPKRKVKMDYGDGSIYFVKSRNLKSTAKKYARAFTVRPNEL